MCQFFQENPIKLDTLHHQPPPPPPPPPPPSP